MTARPSCVRSYGVVFAVRAQPRGKPDGICFAAVDDTVRAVNGYAKRAAALGNSGVRGLNAPLSTVSSRWPRR